MKKYTVKLKQRSYDINIKPGIIKELPLLLSEYNENQKWVIVSQHKIMELFGYELEEKLKKNDFICSNVLMQSSTCFFAELGFFKKYNTEL